MFSATFRSNDCSTSYWPGFRKICLAVRRGNRLSSIYEKQCSCTQMLQTRFYPKFFCRHNHMRRRWSRPCPAICQGPEFPVSRDAGTRGTGNAGQKPVLRHSRPRNSTKPCNISTLRSSLLLRKRFNLMPGKRTTEIEGCRDVAMAFLRGADCMRLCIVPTLSAVGGKYQSATCYFGP